MKSGFDTAGMPHPLPPEIEYANLGELVDAAAARFGAQSFWESIDDGEKLSFAEFAAASRRFANALRKAGIGHGTHVAVMMPNSVAYALAWIALSRLGAVTVPINANYTAHEIAYVVRDSDSTHLLIDDDFASLFDEARGELAEQVPAVIRFATRAGAGMSWRAFVADFGDEVGDGEGPVPSTLCSIQYTSGSTGFPKGCLLGHDYWLLLGYVRSRQGPAPKRMIVDRPLTYMGGKWRLLIAFFTGAAVVVARKFSLSQLFSRLIEHRIDFLYVSDPVAKLDAPAALRELDFAWICSAGISPHLHKDIERMFDAPVRELYGMTEIGSTLFMPFDDAHMSGSGSCGKPALGRKCRIVDDQGRDVADGETGELWVSGPGILTGYYKKDEANRASFSGEWFRTGDLFRRDEEGYFYMQGRIKDSIRRSGENISALEVEAVAAGAPGVLEVAVVGVKDDFRGEEVKLCVVLQQGKTRSDVPPVAVLQHCEAKLAGFKVPRYVEYFDGFPHTSSLKIAKHMLKDGPSRVAGSATFDRVANAWLHEEAAA